MKRFTFTWSAMYTITLLLLLVKPGTLEAAQNSSTTLLMKEAQAGVSTVAILEALNTPATFRTVKVQAFIDAAFQRFHVLSPNISARDIKRMRDELRGNAPPQLAIIQQQFLKFEEKLQTDKTPEHRDAWMVGVRAMQIEYNALHTKDRTTANTLLNQLALLSSLDSVMPAIHELRASLQTLHALQPPNGAWQQQVIAANAIATIIAAFGTNHHQILTALVVRRAPTNWSQSESHIINSVEILSADGGIQTISGYSDGPAEAPAGRLHCGMNHGPYQPADVAIPLTLPVVASNTRDPSVERLINACAAFEETRPSIVYLPPSSVPEAIIPHLLLTIAPNDWNFILASAEHSS